MMSQELPMTGGECHTCLDVAYACRIEPGSFIIMRPASKRIVQEKCSWNRKKEKERECNNIGKRERGNEKVKKGGEEWNNQE